MGWLTRKASPKRDAAGKLPRVPPTASLYGPGPSHTADRKPGAWSPPGAPHAPQIGRDALTHGQIAKQGAHTIPNPRLAPQRHARKKNADITERHSVERVDGDGWPTLPPSPHKAAPYPTPAPANRNIQHALYSFTRPFDQTIARRLNGTHFSLADHRRNYHIGGMQPVHRRRNTYRLDPAPWDARIVDMPAEREPDVVQAVYRVPGYPDSEFYGSGKSWRL